jgi:oxalate decarboxylase
LKKCGPLPLFAKVFPPNSLLKSRNHSYNVPRTRIVAAVSQRKVTQDEKMKTDKYTRRRFLELGSGAMAGAGILSIQGQNQQSGGYRDQSQQKDKATSDPGPANQAIDAQNPDSFSPPPTDHGAVSTFKYPFSFAHKRLEDGGWSREVTVRELSISKSIAGVNMRLTAGGVRELHWHAAAEWAYMLYGKARITGFDTHGKPFISDVGVGDLWYFPAGVPHSLQGLGPDGAEFMLVFDDGSFSEYETVQLTDWTAHTPLEVLAKNVGVPESAFKNIPAHELYIFQADVPGSLEDDIRAIGGASNMTSERFDFHMLALPPTRRTKGGEVRIADSSNFTVSRTIAAALVTVHRGGMRELHWHPNADEWQYFISGKARMTVFATSGRARTMDFQAGDVGYIQQTFPHYVENTGETDLVFLEMFKSSSYQEITLNEWLSHMPPELVAAHLHMDKATLDAIPKDKIAVVPR